MLNKLAVGWLSIGLLSLAVLLIGGFGTAFGQQNFSREKFPQWVVDYPVPKSSENQSRSGADGIDELLQDTQIRIDGRDEEMFRRTIQRVTNRTGLENAAKLQLEFSPDTDDIILYRAAIWRDGRLLDQTTTVRAELMRRESELESDVITNNQTVDIRLTNVRVGDLIDYAWAWRSKKSYWPGHHFSTHRFGWSVPVKQVRLRLVKPANLITYTKFSKGLPDPVETRSGNTTSTAWTLEDSLPVPDEENTPEWLEPLPQIEISTMPDWKSVVDWALPLYKVSDQLPNDLVAKVNEIAAKSANPTVRTTEALRLVQDNVRYTSIPLVSGGYAPRIPSDTWNTGYGDCKDKSALLVAVLRRLNIKAVPALTDTSVGPKLPQLQPSAVVFNHVIVRVYGLSKPLWLDPTSSHQGGMAPDIADLDYGYALPLQQGQNEFETIENLTSDTPTIDVRETHNLTDKGVAIDVLTIYSHDEADLMRRQIAKNSRSEFDQNGLEYFASMYPNITQVGEANIEDNRNTNKLTVSQQYFLPMSAGKYDDTLASYQINAWTVSDLYPTIKATKRITSIDMPTQINRLHIIKLATPGRIGLPSDEKIDGESFLFERTTRRTSEHAIIEFSLKGKAKVVNADSSDAYRDEAARLENLSYEYVDMTDDFGGYLGLFLGATLIYVVGGLALLFIRTKQVRAAEVLGKESETLCPVGSLKFCLLTVSTSGVYVAFWFWRCWRQLRQREGLEIQPFWRALFGGFWSFALFDAARERADRKMATWVGASVMILYLLTGFLGFVADRTQASPIAQIGLSLLTAIILLPLVKQVNDANTSTSVAEFSKIRSIHWAVVAASLPFTIGVWITG